jgi:hypothetical protein
MPTPLSLKIRARLRFVRVDADLAGRFRPMDSAQLDAVVGVLQQFANKHVRFRVQAVGQQPNQTLKTGAHLGHGGGRLAVWSKLPVLF